MPLIFGGHPGRSLMRRRRFVEAFGDEAACARWCCPWAPAHGDLLVAPGGPIIALVAEQQRVRMFDGAAMGGAGSDESFELFARGAVEADGVVGRHGKRA